VQFGHEGRTSQSRPVMTRDHQAQATGEVRLFNQAKCFGCIRYTNHIAETLFERRHPYECLQRIVVN